MRILNQLRAVARRLFRRSQAQRDLDEEIAAFVAELTDEYRKRGLDERAARRAALADLGGMDQVKESVREAWAAAWVHTLWRDVRFSARSLLGQPGFTTIAVLTLALGVGGATAVFSVMDAVLYRPPPGIEDSHHVVAINRLVDGTMRDGLSYPELEELRERIPALTSVAAHVGAPMRLRTPDGPRRNIIVDFATGDYFELLGVKPSLGRLIGATDADLGDPRAVLVLSHRAWRRDFAEDPDVIGRVVELTNVPYRIIGVAARGFEGTMTGQQVDAWAPLPMIASRGLLTQAFAQDRSLRFLSVLGRVRADASVAGLNEALGPREFAVSETFGRYPALAEDDARFYRLVGGAVVLLLLLACANVSSLCLLRGVSRRYEMAARLALGAPRGALIRRLLVESTLLAGLASLAGAVAADLFVARTRLLAPRVMAELTYGVDARVLWFSVLLGIASVVLVSLFPMLQLGRVAPMTVLRASPAGGASHTSITRRGLVVIQVGVSFALVTTAGSIIDDMARLTRNDPGFDTEHLAYVYFDLRTHEYDKDRMDAATEALESAARESPAIAAATLANAAPLLGRGPGGVAFADLGTPVPMDTTRTSVESGLSVRSAAVLPSYFGVLGIPLLAGRAFRPDDRSGSEDVTIVTRSMALSLWGSPDAVGRHLYYSRRSTEPPRRLRVVGLAADHKHTSILDNDSPVVYIPLAQAPVDGLVLIGRGTTEPPLPALRTALRSVDPELYADMEATTNELVANWTASQRSASHAIGLFGVIALLLSSLGVYGAVGHLVTGREREFAMRSALGAGSARLTWLAMSEGMTLVATGLLLGGLLLSWTQLLARRSLEGVGGPSMTVVLMSLASLVLAMALSSYMPTRRVRKNSLVDALKRA